MGQSAESMGTLGILGGGQLARMTAISARAFGYRVIALDPDPRCPVASLVDELVVGSFADADAALSLAGRCDAVTYDQEHIAPEVLDVLSAVPHVRPRAQALRIVQDRSQQKAWLAARGFPVGPYAVATSADTLREALVQLGPRTHVKACRGGFDGRGQCVASAHSDPTDIVRQLGTAHILVERSLPLRHELSVLVARRPSGEVSVAPPALNVHVDGVLSHSVLPAQLPQPILDRATDLASAVATELGIAGVCVVEMFVLEDDTLLVNELALRTHNSYHGSERALETSQFEQLIRAVFDLPLGPVGLLRPTAMVNLLGDVWLGTAPPDFQAALRIPTVRLHLYGKHEVRPGRKLGHLTATGASTEEALARALTAHRVLDAWSGFKSGGHDATH